MKMPVATKSLGSATDLTIIADLKQGMAQEWEAISYTNRAVAIMRMIYGLRAGREERIAALSMDNIENIEAIHSFRVGLTNEPKGAPPRLLLSVTFDFHWEPYMRVIWRDLGRLLDPVLVNCEGYPIAVNSSYEQYIGWVRENLIRTEWFYNATHLTVTDLTYLQGMERVVREGRTPEETDLALARFRAKTPPEALANAKTAGPVTPIDAERQTLSALIGFFSLVRFYGFRPGWECEDGKWRPNDAMLLLNIVRGVVTDADIAALSDQDRMLHAQQIDWFRQPFPDRPGGQAPAPQPPLKLEDVQKGVLTSFRTEDKRPTNHGVMLLYEVTDAAAARTSLAPDGPFRSSEAKGEKPLPIEAMLPGLGEKASVVPGFAQVALTWRGLQSLEVKQMHLDKMPREFRDGAAVRSPAMGDLRAFHPRNWKSPPRNWPAPVPLLDGTPPPPPPGTVELSEVDVMIQLRVRLRPEVDEHVWSTDHPLHLAVSLLESQLQGLRLVSVIPMLGASEDGDTDHFGLRGGLSQPKPVPAPSTAGTERWSDETDYGEIILGQPDGRKLNLDFDDFSKGGSFLVVRRMRQFRDRLEKQLAAAGAAYGIGRQGREKALAAMLGRHADGTPLVDHEGPNDFNYQEDPDGRRCPLQSHVRRSNPRTGKNKDAPPRIMRRGMSYGPRLAADRSNIGAERGVMFMAYCASIAEQFEVVQRWVNGGNSTRIGSFMGDPLMGVPRRGDARMFRHEVEGKVCRSELNPNAQGAVGLDWMHYFFVPSVPVLKELTDYTESPVRPDTVTAGQKLIAQLRWLENQPDGKKHIREQWQALFDDAGMRQQGLTASVWEAVRAGPKDPNEDPERVPGVLKCPYALLPEERDAAGNPVNPGKRVMVGDGALIAKILADDEYFTVDGYDARAKQSMGSIYLGFDKTTAAPDPYTVESAGPNKALQAVGEVQAFAVAFKTCSALLNAHILPADGAPRSLSLVSYFDAALGALCEYWFRIPDARHGGEIELGGLDYRKVSLKGPGARGDDMRAPMCPGDYFSPSRYMFDPTPSVTGVEMGQWHGRALHAASTRLFGSRPADDWGRMIGPRPETISRAIYEAAQAFPGTAAEKADYFARTLVGVMMGFLPPSWGSLLGIFDDWLASGELWRVQSELIARGVDTAAPAAQFGLAARVVDPPMRRAMQRRPAPDFIWRRAKQPGRITADGIEPHGSSMPGVDFIAGEMFPLSIYSATLATQAAELAAGGTARPDVFAIFGGDRSANGVQTHACPAYKMAMGSLLGVVTALLAAANVRKTQFTLSVDLSRRT
jgi:Dyp-type peroxidase family